MYSIGDYVVYNNNVCKIFEIKEKHYFGKDYYLMHPIDDDSLNIEVPIDNKLIKSPISKEQALELIDKIPNIGVLEDNTKMIENTYKQLMKSSNLEDLVKIIKTTYLRNDYRIKNNKRISEKDMTYFYNAEKRLYNELSISLGLTFKETKEYIINKLNNVDIND